MEINYETLLNTSFKDATIQYLYSLRLLLALSDEGDINDLQILNMMNDKMNHYLKAIIEAKKNDKNFGAELSFKNLYNMIGREGDRCRRISMYKGNIIRMEKIKNG